MDVLETYPRDELFQTPIDELVPIAQSVLVHPRAPPAPAVHPARHLWPLSLVPGLPAAGPLQHDHSRADRRILEEQLHGDSIEYTARVSESMLARVHFVVRPKPGELISDSIDTADLERRLAEAARSWQDDFVTSVLNGVR